jgi:hypothetical protein
MVNYTRKYRGVLLNSKLQPHTNWNVIGHNMNPPMLHVIAQQYSSATFVIPYVHFCTEKYGTPFKNKISLLFTFLELRESVTASVWRRQCAIPALGRFPPIRINSSQRKLLSTDDY